MYRAAVNVSHKRCYSVDEKCLNQIQHCILWINTWPQWMCLWEKSADWTDWLMQIWVWPFQRALRFLESSILSLFDCLFMFPVWSPAGPTQPGPPGRHLGHYPSLPPGYQNTPAPPTSSSMHPAIQAATQPYTQAPQQYQQVKFTLFEWFVFSAHVLALTVTRFQLTR